MIKFGISENYVPNWGVVQAIREIYQNFIDYGEFEVEVSRINDTHSAVRISNKFMPDNWEFLKIGFSRKGEGAIGKHGEGLKLAGLIFLRNHKMFRITTSLGRAVPTFYDDENIGICYGLDISDMCYAGFEVYFEADTKDIEVFQQGYVKKEDILQSSYYGDIVNKDAGNIYVGGLFVYNLKDLKYALNFKPSQVDLGRDRDMPSTWDIEYYTNRIINSCSKDLKFRATDVHNREFNVGDIPKELSGKFKPVISEQGNLQLHSGATVVTKAETIRKLSENPIVAKRIAKLQYKATFKETKSPTTLLLELRMGLYLNDTDKLKFADIIKISRNWRIK